MCTTASKLPRRNGWLRPVATAYVGAAVEPVGAGTRSCASHAVEGQVGAEHLTAGPFGEVQAWPPRPGADVGQADTGTERQEPTELVGLGSGRVPGRPVVGPEGVAFDVETHRRAAQAVLVGEPLDVLRLGPRRNHRSQPGWG